MSTAFSDRLASAIERTESYLCAGLDPVIDDLPFFATARLRTATTREMRSAVTACLADFYRDALKGLSGLVSIVKPNSAFFEQYGPAGMDAFAEILSFCRSEQMLTIADAKRGDIGSTAKAYSRAFLNPVSEYSAFDADALTVNPYLGTDTIQEFLLGAKEAQKGIFVLVRTSNPGSALIQGAKIEASTVSDTLARWLDERSAELIGACGWSGLGAVIGSTYPEEAAQLRTLMPRNLFLIPGMGAQGGTANDAVRGFGRLPSRDTLEGAVVNVSRGLFSAANKDTEKDVYYGELQERARKFNRDIMEARSRAA